MSLPSKQQLRRKYKISNADFQILTNPPPENEIREKGFLVKVGEAFGGEEWMWKTWTGVVLAIIIIVPTFQSTLDYWRPKVVYSVTQFSDYFRHLRWPLSPSDDQWIAFVPDAALPPKTEVRSFHDLSIGSSLVPGPAQSPGTAPIQFVSQIRYHFRERFLNTPGPVKKPYPLPPTRANCCRSLTSSRSKGGRVESPKVLSLFFSIAFESLSTIPTLPLRCITATIC